MVRNYKRKTKRGDWSKEAMKKAVEDVLARKSGYRKAASNYGVPQTTLERYVNKVKKGTEVTFGVPLGPIEKVFSNKEEEEIVSYLKHMEERLFGLTTLDLRRMAYELAIKNNKKHNFNVEKKIAGITWLKAFLNRHPDLSIRKPEATSAARAMGFNKVAVGKFYQLLGDIYDKHKLTPDKIFNCDETGISVVSKTKSKILAMKGRRQVGSLSSAERGQTVTVEICFNAAGTYMPPLMIFPGQRMKAELLDHAPPGTTAACNPRGWINTEIFTIWFKQFIQFSGVTPDNKVLLLLDGHVSHTQNIEVIDLARQNGVIILCFPPHCTHRLQPLDVAFMRPLSTYYDHAATNWLRSHPGRVLTMFQISEIFGQAYLQAATMTTALNGFKKCGIWPYNQDNFTDVDFLSAETTNIPLNENTSLTSNDANRLPVDISTIPNIVIGNRPSHQARSVQTNEGNLQFASERHAPSTPLQTRPDFHIVTLSQYFTPTRPTPSSHVSTPSLPDAQQPDTAVESLIEPEPVASCSYPTTSSQNSTPSQPDAQQPDTAIESQVEPEPVASCSHSTEANSPIRAACRNLTSYFQNASPRDIIAIPTIHLNQKRKQYRRGKTAIITSTPYKNELEDRKRQAKPVATKKTAKKPKGKGKGKGKTTQADTVCIYCNDENNSYLKSSENWVGCQRCGRWTHTACAGVDDDDPEEVLICFSCEEE